MTPGNPDSDEEEARPRMRRANVRKAYFPTKWRPEVAAGPVSREMRPCPECGSEHLLPVDQPEAPCFRCWRAKHPYDGCTNARIDAAGDDARDPHRIREGTAGFNIGLRGVDTVVGVRECSDPNLNGKPRTDYRPITNHEVGSNVRRREIAARQGLEVRDRGVYRGLR